MSGGDAWLRSVFKPGRCAFIPYVMAGDPDMDTTRRILHALQAAGADAIELGIPYGDPLADGPTIAAAGVRGLAGGATLTRVLQLVEETAARLPPIVLFTYFNPVYQYGTHAFARDAAQAGAAGAIVPDVTLEESVELREAFDGFGLAMPLLIAPSTPRERAARLAAASRGFVYIVSRLGVTGAGRALDHAPVRSQVMMLREVTEMPLALGFGISSANQIQEIAPLVDGVIVGSALIDAYAGKRGATAADAVKRFVDSLLPHRVP
ncbi:MAG TPA: tryptophan synthase subunit alpha [Candidatus Baltobacteraceae bacterium]|jgi:tryptophan synthase alpha chain|nr:tryptophan synthase subunit alpha [Candidatus Baltobacteraceae bacterium]